jgi:hypothetical protein
MPTTIQIRRSPAASWSASTVLADGEIGYETDTGNYKVGDGSTQWSSLVYQFPYSTGLKTSALSATLTVDNANDRVGIGTTTPAQKLDVVGDVQMSGDCAINGGDITTSSGTFNIASTLTSSQTINVGTGVTASSNTKTLNLATGGASGSTTNVNIGSSIAGTTAIAGNATVGGTLGVTGVITGPGTIPIGGIIMWNGSVVPSGWQLCDGTNSTPDLRNKFILGGNSYATSAWRESITGSSTSSGGTKDAIVVDHTHTLTDPGHFHSFTAPQTYFSSGLGGGGDPVPHQNTTTNTASKTTGITIASAGSSGTNQNLPPYFVLAFIQRMT